MSTSGGVVRRNGSNTNQTWDCPVSAGPQELQSLNNTFGFRTIKNYAADIIFELGIDNYKS